MKKMFLIIVLFLSVNIFAQKIIQSTREIERNIIERIETESVPGYGMTHFKEGAWTVQTIGSTAPNPGTMFYVRDYKVSMPSAFPTVVNITYGNSAIIPSGQIQKQARITESVCIPLNQFFKEKEAITLTFTTSTGGDTNTKVFGSAEFDVVSSDFFKVGTPIVCLSDSILSGTGPSTGLTECVQLLITYLEANTDGKFRKVLKGQGGWNSTHALNFVNAGEVQYVKSDFGIFVIALGMNDTSAATYSTNLSSIITEVKKAYPNWVIWVFGPTPAQGNWPNGTPGLADGTSRESVLSTIRTNASNIVTALADTKIWYTNLGTAFSSSGDTNYFTADGTTTGNRIHPNDAGNQGMFTTTVSTLTASTNAKLTILKNAVKRL